MKSRILLGASLTLAGSFFGTALAQSPDAGEDVIYVTATKREQSLQDTPVAVSVVGTTDVERAQITDLKDLQTIVPSLRISTLQNSSQTTFIIRGFGNGANNPGIESSVGVFIDGVYRSRSAAAILDLPVLERVEVLRGPQSTLFGKNVSAGAVSIITQKPDYVFNGKVEGTVGDYNQRKVAGTITGPIFADRVAARVSGSYNQRDGYYTNAVTGTEINNTDRWSVRGDVFINATQDLTFRIIGDYNEIDEVCCGVVQLLNGPATASIGATPPFGLGKLIDPAGDDSYSIASDVDPYNRLEGQGLSLQADWDLGFATLTSITAKRKQTDDSDADIDFTGARIATNPQSREYDTFTQEVRLASNNTSPLAWLVGAFYFDEKVTSKRDVVFGPDFRAYADGLAVGAGAPGAFSTLEGRLGLPVGTTFFGAGQGYFGNYEMDNTSYSIFGQLDYDVTDRLTATVGVAYLNDEKEYTLNDRLTDTFSGVSLVQVGFGQAFGTLTGGLPPTPANIAANPVAAGQAQAISTTACSPASPPPACNSALALRPFQFFAPPVNVPSALAGDDGLVEGDQVVWTGRVTYQVSDSVNTYATYSTGWKASAVNLSSDSRPADANGIGREASPEKVELIEAGAKTKFDNGFVNVAVFKQTIEGFQSNLFIGTGFALSNAGQQSVVGYEIEGLLRPIDPLTWTFGLTYLDPEYDEFKLAPCASFDTANCGAGQTSRDLSGTTPAGISQVTLSTALSYDHQFTDSLKGFVRGEYSHQSKVAPVENVEESVASREVNNINASVGLTINDATELMLWVRNATDDRYLQSAFPTVAQSGSFSGYLNEPRTYGLTLRQSF